ncbi:hypothetical protein BDR06DRAFT_968236 [Suillus hirtellus]|nr:hypothetical protein BDR06DRAFT_968236 [Suillus hirtellus]
MDVEPEKEHWRSITKQWYAQFGPYGYQVPNHLLIIPLHREGALAKYCKGVVDNSPSLSIGIVTMQMMDVEPERECWQSITKEWYTQGLVDTSETGSTTALESLLWYHEHALLELASVYHMQMLAQFITLCHKHTFIAPGTNTTPASEPNNVAHTEHMTTSIVHVILLTATSVMVTRLGALGYDINGPPSYAIATSQAQLHVHVVTHQEELVLQ